MKARGERIAAQWWERVRARRLFPYELCTPAVVNLQREVLCSFPWLPTQPQPACGSSIVQLLLGYNRSCGLGLLGSVLTMHQVDWVLL